MTSKKPTPQNANTSELILEGTLGINKAEELCEKLRALSAEDSTIKLEASQVERITTPCVQLLLSLGKTIQEDGGSLEIIHPSEALQQSFETLGLSSELTTWSVK